MKFALSCLGTVLTFIVAVPFVILFSAFQRIPGINAPGYLDTDDLAAMPDASPRPKTRETK